MQFLARGILLPYKAIKAIALLSVSSVTKYPQIDSLLNVAKRQPGRIFARNALFITVTPKKSRQKDLR